MAESFEILFALFFHEIVFVGKRPPHIAIGSESAEHVPEIAIILSGSHTIEAPVTFIVRMKEYEIGFDSKVAEVCNALFQVLKEFGIESREIPITRGSPFERIQQRLVRVPIVMFWENTKTNFVEG